MILCVSVQNRFSRTPDGACWTGSAFPHAFWERYLQEFDGVRVVARVLDVPAPPERTVRSDGPRVTFAPLPCYVGPWEFLQNRGLVRAAMRHAIGPRDAVLFRVPAPFPALCLDFLARRGQPFGVEVLGDPVDLFSPGTYTTPVLPLVRFLTWLELRRVCQKAAVAAYVTQGALQRRYPTRGILFAFSDVCLESGELAARPRAFPRDGPPFRLLFIGSLHHRQKGPDVLLRAVQALGPGGPAVVLTMVGDGPERPGLERLARDLGLGDAVRFVSGVPDRRVVRGFLEEAHLFVLPSRAEGLPRVLLEAMAVGLPCLSTTVGGIPEILAAEDLVPSGEAGALGRAIRDSLSNPGRWEAMSRRNLATAARFTTNRLAVPHAAFLQALRRETAGGGGRGR